MVDAHGTSAPRVHWVSVHCREKLTAIVAKHTWVHTQRTQDTTVHCMHDCVTYLNVFRVENHHRWNVYKEDNKKWTTLLFPVEIRENTVYSFYNNIISMLLDGSM